MRVATSTNIMSSAPGMKSQLLHLFIEVAIFLASELLLRPFSVRRYGSLSISKFNLLMAQGSILSLCITLLYLYHHIAYILVIATILIFGRALWMKQVSLDSGSPNSHGVVISKPLGIGLKSNNNGHYNVTKNLEHLSSCDAWNTGMAELSTVHHRLPHKKSLVESTSVHSKLSKNTENGSYPRSVEVLHSKTGMQESTKTKFSNVLSSPYQLIYQRLPLTYIHDSYAFVPVSGSSHQAEKSTGIYNTSTSPSTKPPGLLNTGNTCFVNSILQCLAWTPGFSSILSNLSLSLSNDETNFLKYLKDTIDLCRILPDGRSVFSPISTDELLLSMSCLAQHLVTPVKSPQHQQDAAEFLLWLLNNLHSACQIKCRDNSGNLTSTICERMQNLRRSKKIYEEEINAVGSKDLAGLNNPMTGFSEVAWELHRLEHSSALNDMFMGQLLEARKCQSCNKITLSSEYFTLLPLPIRSSELTECIRLFTSLENLEQDNMISCSCSQGGSLMNATRQALLGVVPKCLVIQLTRFTYDNSQQVAVKNYTHVYLTTSLDFSPYTMNYIFKSDSGQSMHYSLHAVCVHSGGQMTSCGHYVAYCRASDSQWYHYNDDIVTPIADIEKELNTSFVLQNAYLLFYHRVDCGVN